MKLKTDMTVVKEDIVYMKIEQAVMKQMIAGLDTKISREMEDAGENFILVIKKIEKVEKSFQKELKI